MRFAAAAILASASGLTASPAAAFNGLLSFCTGAQSCGMGGAGLALATDASNVAINPALLGNLDTELSASVGWMHVPRTMTSLGTIGNAAAGTQNSTGNNIPDGSLAGSYRISPEWSVGGALFLAGAGASQYDRGRIGVAPVSGTYDSGNRMRIFNFTPGFAYKPVSQFSVGASLILGYMDYKANLAQRSLGETSGHNDLDSALGWGVRVGTKWDIGQYVSVGATAASAVRYQRLDKYKDVFNSSIQQPPSVGGGITLHPFSSTDISADYKMNLWSRVPSVAMSAVENGYGWVDQHVIALGIQQRLGDDWTIRAGWNYGTSPITNDNVFINALFPAVATSHFTGGASVALSEVLDLSASGFYSPTRHQRDPGTGDFYSQNGKGTDISIEMYGAQIGIRRKF